MRAFDPDSSAFGYLRHRLARRRFSQLDFRLRLELALLALLLTGFVFWQVRGPFASVAASGGARAVLTAVAGTWVALASLAASIVAVRHAHRLRRGPPGPSWLALPIHERALARHLAWDSGLVAIWIAVPAIGVWSATLGLIPWPWALGLVVPLAWLLAIAGRGGAALGERLAVWGLRGPTAELGVAGVLAEAASPVGTRRMRPARWAARPAWLALCLKDLRVTARVGNVRRHLGTAILFWLLSALAWRLPSPPHMTDLEYVAAFILALLGSAALGEWLVSLSGSDPFQALRSLPLGVADVWVARFALALVATALLLALHSIAGSDLTPHALRLFVVWVGGATLAIAALAVNYGVTLFPRADIAQRLLGLSLGLAVAASLMIPLLGWVVLLSAVLHSARRLSRWAWLEEG